MLSTRNWSATCSRGAPSRSAQSDLGDPFHHRQQGDVGDPDRADEKCHRAEHEKERVHVGLHLERATRPAKVGPWRAGRSAGSVRARSVPGGRSTGPRPRSVRIRTSSGATRPNHRRAVPFGTMTESSSSMRSATPSMMPTTVNAAVAEEHGRHDVDAGDVRARGRVHAEHGDLVAPTVVAGIEEAPGHDVSSRRVEQSRRCSRRAADPVRRRPTGRRLRRSEPVARPGRVAVGASGDDAVQASETLLGVPRKRHRFVVARNDRIVAGARLDDDVRGGDRVEAAGDLAAGGLRQPDGRDQCRDAEHGSERCERGTAAGRAATPPNASSRRSRPASPRVQASSRSRCLVAEDATVDGADFGATLGRSRRRRG